MDTLAPVMSDPPNPDPIRLLLKPLHYAAGLDPGRLPQIMPDLGRALAQILDAHAPGHPEFSAFRDRLAGLDSLPAPERTARVRELISILDSMEDVDQASGPSPPRKEAGREHAPAGGRGLETEIQWVKGVGPKMAERFGRLGIATVEDLLYHLPLRYEDRRHLVGLRDLVPDRRATVLAEVMACGPVMARHGQRQYHLLLSDGAGLLNAIWFQYAGDYLEQRFKQGQWVMASGVVKAYQGGMQMAHPDVEVVEDEGGDEAAMRGLIPVYPATEGLHQKYLRRVMATALESFGEQAREFLPATVLRAHGFSGPAESLRAVHAPADDADEKEYNEHRSASHRRLAYEEFFLLELGLALRRRGIVEEPAVPLRPGGELLEGFRRGLPFALSPAQEKVIAEVMEDLGHDRPMHRLLHGEVGSGKTVVALYAAVAALAAGYQAALMAPTEILAEQHYRTVSALLTGLPIRAALLTSAVRGREREAILAGAGDGSLQLLIGTHAVIQEQVKFKGLCLAIVDEQHRFGVLQRAKLKAKGPAGTSPHLLVMTATPIPRSLAMTVYGDLAVSVIREPLPGRHPIKTRLFKDNERVKVYELMRREAAGGGQVYVVYPLIEESEALELQAALTMYERFRGEVFPELRVGLLHGRMKSEDKDAVMQTFSAGGIDVLVATTVIEVGIDVPNASMMVIEQAERFGLSQLHQLRGRVGRGGRASSCIMVAAFTRSEDAWQRLRAMTRTTDGFKIAEEDLALRGPGEFFGTRQSGRPDFRVANIIRDVEVLTEARKDAFALAADDPGLGRPEHARLKELLLQRWGKRLKLGRVG
jgi:ATP-dependent DNA helicase RecG